MNEGFLAGQQNQCFSIHPINLIFNLNEVFSTLKLLVVGICPLKLAKLWPLVSFQTPGRITPNVNRMAVQTNETTSRLILWPELLQKREIPSSLAILDYPARFYIAWLIHLVLCTKSILTKVRF